jgi:hypothetical protein
MNSPHLINGFQPDLSGFPRFAAVSHAALARGLTMLERQRAF